MIHLTGAHSQQVKDILRRTKFIKNVLKVAAWFPFVPPESSVHVEGSDLFAF